MAEVDVHFEQGHSADAFGQRVGIMVGVIGILLSIVTILGHREHSAAVVHKTEANDQWAFYQAKKIREHNAQIGVALLNALAADPAKVAAFSAKLTQDGERYTTEAEEIRTVALARDEESKHAERRALRFDVGEGFLELGLVMSSLYFLSRKRFFVALGGVGAVAGTLTGAIGWLS
ncbi:MAG: DUF4337 domain-containing protein [Steroidobacteraceae bacterium]|jgi:hypothetical protein